MHGLCSAVLTFAFLAPQPVARADQIERTLWVYEAGWFEKKEGTSWIEVNRDIYNRAGKVDFKEVHRSDRFVEIYDSARKLTVRLSETRMEWREDGHEEWNLLYEGRWKE